MRVMPATGATMLLIHLRQYVALGVGGVRESQSAEQRSAKFVPTTASRGESRSVWAPASQSFLADSFRHRRRIFWLIDASSSMRPCGTHWRDSDLSRKPAGAWASLGHVLHHNSVASSCVHVHSGSGSRLVRRRGVFLCLCLYGEFLDAPQHRTGLECFQAGDGQVARPSCLWPAGVRSLIRTCSLVPPAGCWPAFFPLAVVGVCAMLDETMRNSEAHRSSRAHWRRAIRVACRWRQ